jgi:hypothetical protein
MAANAGTTPAGAWRAMAAPGVVEGLPELEEEGEPDFEVFPEPPEPPELPGLVPEGVVPGALPLVGVVPPPEAGVLTGGAEPPLEPGLEPPPAARQPSPLPAVTGKGALFLDSPVVSLIVKRSWVPTVALTFGHVTEVLDWLSNSTT